MEYRSIVNEDRFLIPEISKLNKFLICKDTHPELYTFVEDRFHTYLDELDRDLEKWEKEKEKISWTDKIHLGIIPDGNRRWCKMNHRNHTEYASILQHLMVRLYNQYRTNHKYHTKTVPELFSMVGELSIYILSKDNLTKRHSDILNLIEHIFEFICIMISIESIAKSVKIIVHGEIELLPKKIQQQIKHCTDLSCGSFTINLAIGYDPMSDSKIYLNNGCESRRQIDMVIRSGGQLRSSGFYPLQTLYSEWMYFDKFWPDMTPSTFYHALIDFLGRQRNFGK
jgi:undecaprenyl pyrophosphate synthase